MLDYCEIVESDHRGCMVDAALKDYFNNKLCEWDNANEVTLNLS